MEPTDKQLRFIQDIEDYLGVPFNGTTKEDATKYLSKYAPIFQDMIELEYEERYDTSNSMDR